MDDTTQQPPEDIELFTSVEVVKFASISYRQLDYWTRTGILTAVHEAHGSGSHRMYAWDAVCQARTMRRLLAAGFTLQGAHRLTVERCEKYDLGEGIAVTIEKQPLDDITPGHDSYVNNLRKMLETELPTQQGGQDDGPTALQSRTAQGGDYPRG